jgi:phage tail sheath protein FI
MAFQVSAGVNVSEIDYSTTIPQVATSVGAIAGFFNWGPCNQVVQITNEIQLRDTFGKPGLARSNTSDVFFTSASFLQYSNDLRVVRIQPTTTYNAVANNSSNSTCLIANDNVLDAVSAVTDVWVAARYPGSIGNSLKIAYWANTNATEFSTWSYRGLFNKVTGTSRRARNGFNNTTANDEIHLVVIDENGAITGTPNTVLEKFEALSVATNARDTSTGETLYYKSVINQKSKYIRVLGGFPTGLPASNNWNSDITSSIVFLQSPSSTNVASFINGSSGTDNSDSKVRDAYANFANSEDIDISLLLTAGHSANVCQYIVQNIAENRKDCVAFLSPGYANSVYNSDTTTSIVNYRNNALSNLSSSYAVIDSGWKYIYDQYNSQYVWVPLNGDIAGLCARTDQVRDPWFSPAGVQRGQIKNVIKLSFNPNKAQRDTLYQNDINPVVSFTGEGTMLYGDKTMQGFASAFDRINVRRLFITLEKAISRYARTNLFEFNDEFTRSQFTNIVTPFLRTVQSRRGIYDFRVVCDSTNNTTDVIDRNEFVGDIYVKPAKSINFIQLNFVAVRSGVAFEEIVGRI